MTAWNLATIWEIVADNVPDAPAVIQGDRTVTWSEFDRRADGIAAHLLTPATDHQDPKHQDPKHQDPKHQDPKHQDKVALYLYNGPEYLETCFACFKVGMVPVNTNYRYADEELVYLWDNADAVAVVFHAKLAANADRVRHRLPSVRTWIWVDDTDGDEDGGETCPDWATPYESIANSGVGRVTAPWGRGEDDLVLIYTGGTTGMPKGVMWRQDDLVRGVVGATTRRLRGPADYDGIRSTFNRPGRVGLPASPLMHGTGWFSAVALLSTAGSVVLLSGRRFDAEELLDCYERHGVYVSAIVGDALAKPILSALDNEPDRWDLSALRVLNSSGVMWSAEVKQRLLQHLPDVQLVDNFGSSEAMGMAQSVTTSKATAETAAFTVSANTRVIDDDNLDVVPGTDQVGRVAVRGFQPLGYYKDPAKSTETFVTIDGDRYSIPGDYASVASDGTMVLLGRGSACINTGGEKVFPEEVEEVLKLHPSVHDAVVVGVPHERFGEAITAVVELDEDATGEGFDPTAVIDHVKKQLASYKAPKHLVTIDSIGRSASGKVDYPAVRKFALDRLAAVEDGGD